MKLQKVILSPEKSQLGVLYSAGDDYTVIFFSVSIQYF